MRTLALSLLALALALPPGWTVRDVSANDCHILFSARSADGRVTLSALPWLGPDLAPLAQRFATPVPAVFHFSASGGLLLFCAWEGRRGDGEGEGRWGAAPDPRSRGNKRKPRYQT